MLEHMVAAVADGIRVFNESGFAIPEARIIERARNIVQGLIGSEEDIMRLLGDRERCIYWLLRADPLVSAAKAMLSELAEQHANVELDERDSGVVATAAEELHEGLRACLTDMDYPPGSDRAERMRELGEAGRHLPPADRSTT
jgi:hypothetical protein